MTDDSSWRKSPIFREFFSQWKKARGAAKPGSFQNVFSFNFHDLLDNAGLKTAVDIGDAIHEVRVLKKAGMLGTKSRPNRPEEILRLTLPHEAEPRLRALFADELPIRNPVFNFCSIDWADELAFLKSGGIWVAPNDLIKLNAFFRSERNRTEINIKERSLQIFGDEKRLDALRETVLFREDRLSLATLGCYPVAEPLPWERGPDLHGPVLVIENPCTWDTYCRWNRTVGAFSGIVYGGGNRFRDSVSRLTEVFDVVGGIRQVLYFGDIDPSGLRIPRTASEAGLRLGLPPVEPDLWSYSQLLERGIEGALEETNDNSEADLNWIAPLRHQIQCVFEQSKRYAQEGINWAWLQLQRREELFESNHK